MAKRNSVNFFPNFPISWVVGLDRLTRFLVSLRHDTVKLESG